MRWFLVLSPIVITVASAGGALAQSSPPPASIYSPVSARLPTNHTLEQTLPPADSAIAQQPLLPGPPPQRDFRKLMRPTFGLTAEWQAEASDIELSSYDGRVQVPLFPVFGPPPPFLNASFSYTDLNAPSGSDLPADLYDYSLGMSWIRPIHQYWSLRFMVSAAMATDGKNTSSDAWQFRGGVFAMYRPNDRWTWIFGALALGRNDLPAVPAIGVIWQPHEALRFDVTFPRPRVAFLLADHGERQQWATWELSSVEAPGRIDARTAATNS